MRENVDLPFDPEESRSRHALIMQAELTPELEAFVAQCTLMFVGSVGADGRVDVSPKGGAPGFVQVLEGKRVAWGERRGNTMYMTGSNLRETARVGLCFLDPFTATLARINGTAALASGTMDGRFPEAEYCVIVTPDEIFPNCGRALKPLQAQMTDFLGKALAKMRPEGQA